MPNYTIQGQLISATNRQPLPNLRVDAWDRDLFKDDLLGTATSDAAGAFSVEFDERKYGGILDRKPDIYVRVYFGRVEVANTRRTVLWNVSEPTVRLLVPVSGVDGSGGLPGPLPNRVEGQISTDKGLAVPDAIVEARDRGLGTETLLGTGATDSAGKYAVLYDPALLGSKTGPDAFVRVLDAARDRIEIARSPVRYHADKVVDIDLVIPSSRVVRATEYERLLAALTPLLGQTAISALDATGVDYVANRSGWDGRTVAMAARAAQLAPATGIPADHHYALLRAGLPSDAAALQRLPDETIGQALRLAITGAVITNAHSIDVTLRLHRAAQLPALKSFTPATAVSSLGDVLSVTLDAARQNQFLAAYQSTAAAPDQLWSKLAASGFDQATIASLQTDGKLGYLTLQNAPLMNRLRTTSGIRNAEDLAAKGLYRAEAWAPLIGADVPEQVTAQAYATGLAAQVNLSFPTLVVADMVRRGDIPVDAAPAAGGDGEVAAFLRAGHSVHTLGVEPVKTWSGYSQLSENGRAGARLVERLYQLSPSNESMVALSRQGLKSAYQITREPLAVFLDRHGAAFPSAEEATLVYRKAQEVHSTVLNLATMYLSHRSAPNVFAMTGLQSKPSPQSAQRLSLNAAPAPPDASAQPTLETLFESMDYCACDECSSVLGAADYLVELLDFCDVKVSDGTKNPLDVLLARRPDLQNLLLTCENTNIVLPYVDVVNEILEHYIVNGSLDDAFGHNMQSDSVSADLLADPQFVEAGAYDETNAKVFPHALPFDMPLDALRLFMQAWGTTLSDALRVFDGPTSARRELLELNAGELSILTDIAYKALPEYFGEPAGTTTAALNAIIANAKVFCQRTEINAEDLVAILRTTFVNPGIAIATQAERLQVSLTQIQSLFDGVLTDAAFIALVSPPADKADFGGDIPKWLRDNSAALMGVITLTDMSAEPLDCSFADIELRFALPKPDVNQLTDIAYHKLLRFIRLWKKTGWSVATTDLVLTRFIGTASADLTVANIDAAFLRVVGRIANLRWLMSKLAAPATAVDAWMDVLDSTQPGAPRRQKLARLLRISESDLQKFCEVTGIDPLADDMEKDLPSMLRLVDAWATLKSLRINVAELDYLLRSHDDAGKLAPAKPALHRDLKSLRDGLGAVDLELGTVPEGADLAYARPKIALVYDNTVADWFIGMVSQSAPYVAPFPTASESLPAKLIEAGPGLSFDPFAKKLSWRGILSTVGRDALKTAAATLTLADVGVNTQAELDTYVAGFDAAVTALCDEGQKDLDALALKYPELKAAYDAAVAQSRPDMQVQAILAAVLPALRAALKLTALRSTLGTMLKLDDGVVGALTSGPAVLHGQGSSAAAVLDEFLLLQEAVPLNADGVFALMVDPPASDSYILYVGAPQNTKVTLNVDGVDVIASIAIDVSGEAKTAVPVALTAGVLAAVTVTLVGLAPANSADIRWRTKGMAKAAIPPERIYSSGRVQTSVLSLIRLRKAALLLGVIPLTPRELRHLSSVDKETKGFLNDLDADGSIAVADVPTLWTKLAWLAWFSQIKAEESDEDTWVGILEQPEMKTPQGQLVLTARNGWVDADLAAVLARFGLQTADITSLDVLRRAKDALDFVSACGQPAANLVAWSTPAPNAALIDDIKKALRASQAAAAWRTTLQSVNDALRNLRRDALVSYILHHAAPRSDVDTADKLYEYFLIDVEMDACRQSSRIVLALSTVQQFISRCLLNLEAPDVASNSIDSKR